MTVKPLWFRPCLAFLGLAGTAWFRIASVAVAAPAVDTLVLGAPESESSHGLVATRGETLTGGLGETARRLLPPETSGYEGGQIDFTMKVDPERPNFLTARLWGSDRTHDRLILFCEGKQVGYRHLGDVDLLFIGNGSPPCDGRFFYVTTPLPESMTKGKTELHLQIRATGPIWGYGTTFDKYQKPMVEPTGGVYRVYTHTDGFFAPPADEKQGRAPADPPVRKSPGPEVLDALKARVNKVVAANLDKKTLNQQEIWFLARAYTVKWTPAYENPAVVKKALAMLDETYVDFRRDPATVQVGKAIYNPDWFGIGPAAHALVLLAPELTAALDEKIVGADDTTRREGWAKMFAACRDWHREHRRMYTNQSMISDTYGVYLPNRAVALLTPDAALPEADALRYLYESAGLQPWLGSEQNGKPLRPMGDDYLELTDKGLTKELGFVGYYGEVLDWMSAMYEATSPGRGQPGDEKLKAALVKAARARAVFRYPAADDDGNRAMRAETLVGWRDTDHYPGEVMYTQRSAWDGSPVESAAATLDPVLLGGVRQMFDDNQFYDLLREHMEEVNLRVTASLLPVPDDCELIKKQPPGDVRLPMTPGQPDFVFADEEDGVVAIKNGAEILYASLYWRSHYGINNLARVHHIRPDLEHVAVVRQDTQFTPGGQTYTRQDWINFGFARGGLKYPGDLHSALAGETMPIAKVPAGVAFKPGDENIYAGKGDFYTLRYGPYLIGLNMSRDKTFDLAVPSVPGPVKCLTRNGADVAGGTVEKVPPRTTAVFFLGEEAANGSDKAK